MKSLVPCLGLLALACSTVHADTLPSGSYQAFSLQYLGDDLELNPIPSRFTLLGTDAHHTDLLLNSMEEISHVIEGGSFEHSGMDWLQLGLHANPGYRITGVRLTASFNGTLSLGQPPAGTVVEWPGAATNEAKVDMASFAGSWSHPDGATAYDRTGITAPTPLDLQFTSLASDQDVLLDLKTNMHVNAQYTYWSGPTADDTGKSPSYAELSMDHPVLTVYTQPLAVPEPASWAMLGAGLGLVLIRRRRARA